MAAAGIAFGENVAWAPGAAALSVRALASSGLQTARRFRVFTSGGGGEESWICLCTASKFRLAPRAPFLFRKVLICVCVCVGGGGLACKGAVPTLQGRQVKD